MNHASEMGAWRFSLVGALGAQQHIYRPGPYTKATIYQTVSWFLRYNSPLDTTTDFQGKPAYVDEELDGLDLLVRLAIAKAEEPCNRGQEGLTSSSFESATNSIDNTLCRKHSSIIM